MLRPSALWVAGDRREKPARRSAPGQTVAVTEVRSISPRHRMQRCSRLDLRDVNTHDERNLIKLWGGHNKPWRTRFLLRSSWRGTDKKKEDRKNKNKNTIEHQRECTFDGKAERFTARSLPKNIGRFRLKFVPKKYSILLINLGKYNQVKPFIKLIFQTLRPPGAKTAPKILFNKQILPTN